jgi:hypothetical protein
LAECLASDEPSGAPTDEPTDAPTSGDDAFDEPTDAPTSGDDDAPTDAPTSGDEYYGYGCLENGNDSCDCDIDEGDCCDTEGYDWTTECGECNGPNV